jgi:hypothetical protein
VSRESWIVLLLSVPISLATGLLIRPIQAVVERSKKGWQSRRAERQHDEYAAILVYMIEPERFIQNLVFAAFEMIQAIGLVIAGFGTTTLILVATIPETLAAPHHQLHGFERGILWIFGIGGAILNSWGSYRVTKVLLTMHKVRQRMARFDSYVKTLPNDIRIIEIEQAALAFRNRRLPTIPPKQ